MAWLLYCMQSLTWVASVGYTTNEHIENWGCSECSAYPRQGRTWHVSESKIALRVSPNSCRNKDVNKIYMPERSYCDSRHRSDQWDHHQKSIGFGLVTGCPLGSATQARCSHLLAIGSLASLAAAHAAVNSSIDPKPNNKCVDSADHVAYQKYPFTCQPEWVAVAA